ncbi:dihydrofolate reductase family protein [Nocardia otitidiscaviarum]|uniref:dihydrofolate reductase family protein n=1 Tax=Nocardia otitidiscaviarum TaxID=1823 RepID=UPI00189419D8|nr:dihydrofolate reductase family protein [Nocardia otitidiscaviarum]MBF6238067.1 dihydrofolate reductase [Nocardia otitidiscaviarum]
MRDLIVTENITVDGVIDAAGGWFTVAAGPDQSDQVEAVRAQFAACDAVVFGRKTFEEMRGYWPTVVDTDTTGVAEYLNKVHKYVPSRTMTEPGWDNSTVLSGPLADEIRALKEAPGSDIVVTGSIGVVHQLVAAGLVDEFRLFTHPVVLGRGARLFPDGTAIPELRLAETTAFRSGVVLLRYRTSKGR